MCSRQLKLACVVLLAAAVLATAGMRVATAADAPTAAERQQELIEVLRSDAPKATKAITCKKLTLCGDAKAVAVLAPLLADEELASWALIPLEAIPAPEADAALRDAAGKLEGRLLIGVLNSIGVRGDAASIEVVASKLGDADTDVAEAAAVALGKIGGNAAAKALEPVLTDGPAAVRSAVAEGLILCAEAALAAEEADEAVRLYDLVREADLPQPRINEATRGAILARGDAGLPLLVEQLQSEEREPFYMGLFTAREVGTPEVTQAVIAELLKIRKAAASDPDEPAPKELIIKSARYGAGDQWADVTQQVAAMISGNVLSVEASNSLAGDPAPGTVKQMALTYSLGGEEKTVVLAESETLNVGEGIADGNPREAPLIYALGDLGHPAALPVVLEIAEDGSYSSRMAAVRVLAQIGDASAVPVLLKTAQASGQLGTAALESLDKLEGEAVDGAIAAGLGDASGQTLVVLIQLVGSRGIESAVPVLIEAADRDDEQVRLAAVDALGMTVAFDKLDTLVARLLEPRDERDAAAARKALLTAATRMPDRDATATKLLGAMSGASPEHQAALLELTAAVGGPKALAGVGAAARSSGDAMRDLGSRLLGEWMGPDAAPVLLNLAQTTDESKYQVRALRGYLRIARQFEVPLDDRINMCFEALKAAKRVEERKLAMEILQRFPAARGLALAAYAVRDPELRADAGAAAVAIAEKIVADEPAAVATAMKQVIEAGGDPKVIDRAKSLLQQAEGQ